LSGRLYDIHSNSWTIYAADAILENHIKTIYSQYIWYGHHCIIDVFVSYSRKYFTIVFTFVVGFIVSFCRLFRFIVKRILDKIGILRIPVLVMGAGKTAEIVLQHFVEDTGLGYEFIGYLEDNKPNPAVAKLMPHLGTFDDAEEIIKTTKIKNVLVVAPGLNNESIQKIVYRLQPLVKNISFIPDMGTLPLATLDVESLIDGHILAFRVRNNLAVWYNRFVKYVFDCVCTIIGIICLLPVFILISLWIYKDSPGPVIFKHIRVGKNGKEFPCYKFRSMCVDADQKLKELLETGPSSAGRMGKGF
jgi:FlaA1/EpsC-like NDP-sugar epimerase